MKKLHKIFITIIVLGVFYINAQNLSGQDVVINEFMSSNETTLQDEDGDYPDWIELFNHSSQPIDLLNYGISDEEELPGKWIFPSIILRPGEYLVIFASGKDRYDTTELHTNFKIKASGEILLLSGPEGNIIDSIPPVEVATDKTYGRFPDGETELMHLACPTPRSMNKSGVTLSFSHPAGFYTQPFKLFITSSHDDLIYYTFDGSPPNNTSIVFTDSIPINDVNDLPNTISEIPTTPDSMGDHFRGWKPPAGKVPKANVVRAVVYRNNSPVSETNTCTYFVKPDVFTFYKYPIVSITTDSINLFGFEEGIYVPGINFDVTDPDWTGNYFEKGYNWERPVHLEYFEEDGSCVLSQDAGVRIHGKITRHAAQKTFRVYARGEYGKEYFDYQLMAQSQQDKYKRFLLRTTFAGGSQCIIKDAAIHNLVKHLNLDIQNYRPVVVFINGEYWGIHTIRDRIDRYYISLKYGVNKDSIDLLENNAQVIEGSNVNYNEMLDYINNNNLEIQENYEFIKTWVEIENFIDYQIVEIYFGNIDWPGSNIRFWREQKSGSKWRWILFDLDNTCFDYTFDHLSFSTFNGDTSYQNPSWSTFLFRNLLKNEEFKNQFIDRFAYLLNTTLQRDSVLNKIEEFENAYEKGLEKHIKRWKFPRNFQGWKNDINYFLKQFAIERPCIICNYILEYFELDEDEFGFDCNSGLHNSDSFKIKIYPNPVNDFLTIEFEKFYEENIIIEVFNSTGERYYYKNLKYYHGDFTEQVNFSEATPGIYLIRISIDNSYVIKKIIKY